ncbi:MAG TPA: DUF6221 family protein [Jatrophihabitantaceae bacterium]|jgi:hypothetical protein
MSDLTEFLLARIAEDEQGAHAIHDRREDRFSEPDMQGIDCACGVPARVLAFCVAARTIIADYDPIEHPTGPLHALAGIWSDHPDFRQEWRP